MGYPAKSHDFVGRGRATEWMDFRTCAEVNDMQSARTTRRVWGGNPNKYLTGGQMSEKRNLVHWSILALSKPQTAPVRAFPYIERTGRGFQPAVRGLFFLSPKIHSKGRQLPAVRGFFKFSFALVIRETGFWQPTGQRIFPFTPYNTAF